MDTKWQHQHSWVSALPAEMGFSGCAVLCLPCVDKENWQGSEVPPYSPVLLHTPRTLLLPSALVPPMLVCITDEIQEKTQKNFSSKCPG